MNKHDKLPELWIRDAEGEPAKPLLRRNGLPNLKPMRKRGPRVVTLVEWLCMNMHLDRRPGDNSCPVCGKIFKGNKACKCV